VFRTHLKKHVYALWRKIQNSVTLRHLSYLVTNELQVKIDFLVPSPVSQIHGSSCRLTVQYASAERLSRVLNPLNAELNPICYLLALLGVHHFLHVSRIRVKSLTLRQLMSYVYGAPILEVSRSHTTTQHSR